MAFLDNTGVAKLCALIKEKYDNLKSLIAGKQDALTAGTNISINNGVISATDTDTTYTAGTGINIDSNNEISCTVSPGVNLPSTPSNDGIYLLKCEVSSGTPIYSWELIVIGGSY